MGKRGSSRGLRYTQPLSLSKGSPPRHCRGFAIILVLAVLVLLALLSITYIKLALIDRNIARNYMDNKRARLIAQSGIDYAVARLGEIAQSSNFFFSEGWQNFTKGFIKIDGVDTAYTESAGSTYGQDRDVFILNVKDSNSMINVNDGIGNDRVTANTRRMLNALGDVLGIATLGDKIINNRPAQGYTSKQELLKVVTRDEFKEIKDLVTIHSWQDKNVANPVPLSSAVLSAYPVKYNENIVVYRYGRGKDSSGDIIGTIDGIDYSQLRFADEFSTFAAPDSFRHAIYGLDELNPQWIEIVSRSPININQAEEDVLISIISDLEGFFASDRRRNKPSWDAPYSICYLYQTPFNYSPSSPLSDEIGFLYSTESINQILARNIADAIQACIKKRSIVIDGQTLDYTDAGTRWFRGPFKTWSQFNAFIDDLVQKQIILDSRSSIFLEYNLLDIPDTSATVSSTRALQLAHQAKADVLKANFNPNLHLNELNPDANIATLVDKTDLVVNSTEFCFTPMGYFEIKSEGFILKAKGTDNIIMANSKVNALVKLFDAYRETNQKQFLSGQIPDNLNKNSNNELVLEIGPEPAKADAASAIQNEWDGYIQLPTYKDPNSPFLVSMYSHFTTNFKMDEHADSKLDNISSINVPDRTEALEAGPYTYDPRNRLCRSYRDKPGFSPDPPNYAPADLRIDGAYLERHSALAYSISNSTFDNYGVFCYWIKPWFHPEITGKTRSYLSISVYPAGLSFARNAWVDALLFNHFFFPTQAGLDEGSAQYNPNAGNAAPVFYRYYREASMIFGYSARGLNNIKSLVFEGFGQTTPCLNHVMHGDGKTSPLKANQWVHVIGRWRFGLVYNSDLSQPQPAEIYINGTRLANTINLPTESSGYYLASNEFTNSTFLAKTQRLFIGPAGLKTQLADTGRNCAADSTVDEFYFLIHPDWGFTTANNMYKSGRYFRPSTDQSQFISQAINLWQDDKLSPAKSSIENPMGLSEDGISSQVNTIRILGVSWTMYAEGINSSTGQVTITDYKNNSQLNVQGLIKIRINGVDDNLPDGNAGYRPLGLNISRAEVLNYKLTMNIAGLNTSDTILLYSPVFDDITIYYTSGVGFLSYSYFD